MCRHVSGGTSILNWEDGEGPHNALTLSSLSGAEACCRCRQCKKLFDRRIFRTECTECERWTAFCQIWWPIYTCLQRGYTTQAEYDHWLNEIEDD
jgi:hypothetical protein